MLSENFQKNLIKSKKILKKLLNLCV